MANKWWNLRPCPEAEDFGTVFQSHSRNDELMEMRKESVAERRKRKTIQRRPTLVRSAKPGQVLSATYSKESMNSSSLPWRA